MPMSKILALSLFVTALTACSSGGSGSGGGGSDVSALDSGGSTGGGSVKAEECTVSATAEFQGTTTSKVGVARGVVTCPATASISVETCLESSKGGAFSTALCSSKTGTAPSVEATAQASFLGAISIRSVVKATINGVAVADKVSDSASSQ